MTAPAFIIVGRVRKAHGIRGEVVVETITDEPDAVFASGRRLLGGTADGSVAPARTEVHVARSRPFHDGLLISFVELSDRTTADAWRGRYLLVPADELSPPREDELWQHELVGMTVRLEDGAPLGTVEELYDLPQGLALDVRLVPPYGTGTMILNYDERTIASVDAGARVIVVTLPEGLLE